MKYIDENGFNIKESQKKIKTLFTITFRPKLVILDIDSILKVKTVHESVK
jgi:hypothetical protein